ILADGFPDILDHPLVHDHTQLGSPLRMLYEPYERHLMSRVVVSDADQLKENVAWRIEEYVLPHTFDRILMAAALVQQDAVARDGSAVGQPPLYNPDDPGRASRRIVHPSALAARPRSGGRPLQDERGNTRSHGR